VQTASAGVYVAAFLARCNGPQVDEPGMHGVPPAAGDPRARLLVTDDHAYAALASLLPDIRAGMINVLAEAALCAKLVERDRAWKPKPMTAMVCRDTDAVAAVPLPRELELLPVRRLAADAPDGVPVEDAAALAVIADPSAGERPDAFSDYLRSLPHEIRLFAAVDGDGVVRATSGAAAFGAYASVLFVNTHPGWRRRGIGQAMTAAALGAAREAGATQASLDASEDGLRIFLRLGFEALTRATQFSRAG
jgi:ribosomal protein S18 acetylase RimI-like enzyme